MDMCVCVHRFLWLMQKNAQYIWRRLMTPVQNFLISKINKKNIAQGQFESLAGFINRDKAKRTLTWCIIPLHIYIYIYNHMQEYDELSRLFHCCANKEIDKKTWWLTEINGMLCYTVTVSALIATGNECNSTLKLQCKTATFKWVKLRHREREKGSFWRLCFAPYGLNWSTKTKIRNRVLYGDAVR